MARTPTSSVRQLPFASTVRHIDVLCLRTSDDERCRNGEGRKRAEIHGVRASFDGVTGMLLMSIGRLRDGLRRRRSS